MLGKMSNIFNESYFIEVIYNRRINNKNQYEYFYRITSILILQVQIVNN